MVMLMTAGLFAAAATPTFIWLKERAKPDETIAGVNYIRVGFERLGRTVERARHYRDLFAVLIAILVFQCGVGTVVNLAAVYSQEVLKFTAEDSLIMILVVNITAAIGAFIFGFLQDRIGSVRTLCITMLIWLVAIGMAYFATQKRDLWIAANAVGLAMGSSGSAGRALVSKFSPRGRSGEFLGLWGVAVKLATAIGVLAFGIVSYVTSDYRVALLFTGVFFAAGFVLVLRIDEQRGIEASKT
jgi:MFS transporter, UMF1 family